jgi:NADH-quinone oxidoreductase subunit G
MPTFKLDDQEISFEPGETIIQAARKVGTEIPHYCWHPGLSVAANCRMCLVEIEPPPGQRAMMLDVLDWDAKLGDYVPRKKPKLQPGCQIAAVEGMVVRSDSSQHVHQARKTVQELLLLNHPVDCPICDQAGECKLQDYWLEHGQFQKRMHDEPVHKPKAVSFGPTIVYDAERCVMCTRCIRFMDEVAKDPVLEMRERGNLNEISVAPGRELDGHYTFMVDHVCPVGALTTKDFRFKARVWFLKSHDSICQGCATGCNTHLDVDPRNNKVHRQRPRENMAVNKFWMCDEGVLTYRDAQEKRTIHHLVDGQQVTLDKALKTVKDRFEGVPANEIGVVLSAQASLEDNWALLELARTHIGTKHVFFTAAPSGYADDILISGDKNSNRKGVELLAPHARGLADLIQSVAGGVVTRLVVLAGEAEDAAAAAKLAGRVENIVYLSASANPFVVEGRGVVFPICNWAETSGTYVNKNGLSQVAKKALEPLGSARPGWEVVSQVAAVLGFTTSWQKLKEVRGSLPSVTESPSAE